MASVNWQKANVQTAAAMKKHNGKEERVALNHSNKDIDKSKSHLNVYIGADDYAPMYEKVKARIEEVDKEHPPLKVDKNRVTCFMLETPVPQAITEQGKAEDFLRNAHKVFEDFFGKENVGGTCGHFDEQHTYTDKDGKEQMSLVHGHTLVAAYVEWTEDVKKNVKQPNGKYKQVKTGETRDRIGINGKHCESKARLTALNKAMDEMCKKEYGISYNTGETPGKKTVEQLKWESEVREEHLALESTLEALRATIDEAREDNAKTLKRLVQGLPDPPERPSDGRYADWETWKVHHHPRDKNGNLLKEGSRKWRKAMDEEHKRHTEHNAPWLEYDQRLEAWWQKAEQVEAVKKLRSQLNTDIGEVMAKKDELDARERQLIASENLFARRKKQFEDEIRKEAEKLTADERAEAEKQKARADRAAARVNELLYEVARLKKENDELRYPPEEDEEILDLTGGYDYDRGY